MLRVTGLTIKQFRGIGELQLEFAPDQRTAVFVGSNGAGKSSILDCLAILLSRYSSAVKTSTSHGRTFSETDIRNSADATENTIALTHDQRNLSWSLARVRAGRTREAQSSLGELKEWVTDLQAQLSKVSGTGIPLVLYYPVNRAVLDIPLRIRTKHEFSQLSAFDEALAGSNTAFRLFFEWFRSREDLENEVRVRKGSHRDIQLEAVRVAISRLVPEFSDLRIQRSPLRMTVKKNGEELIVSQLSDGEKTTLALAGDLGRRLAIANPTLADPLSGAGIVLIDEVDLHLHPSWQRRIIPALESTFPNCQFILSTHSPQVLTHLHPKSVFLLNQTKGNITCSHPDYSYGREIGQIVEDLMDVPLRPENVREDLRNLFVEIERGNFRQARELLSKIELSVGADEPELTRAAILLHRKEVTTK